MQRLGYFQSTLQILPSSLVHREQRSALVGRERDTIQSVPLRIHPGPALLGSLRCFYLVLVEICNDHADKQGEADHATQEDENVDVDAVDLCVQRRVFGRKRQINTKSTRASCEVRRVKE